MKKVLSILLTVLICCFAAIPSSAQYTLTVADGTETNSYVPIYGYYVDEFVKSQTIYPASMLTSMSGQNITAITFYLQLSPDEEWGVNFRVMLKEVTNDVFSSETFEPTTLNDMVYAGPLESENGFISFVLDYPFTYNGGNLLLEVSSTNTGEYSNCSFLGTFANYASMQGNSSMGVSAITPIAQNFIPKTTFEYGVVSLCPKAHNLSATNVTATSATISWYGSSDATSYVVQYMPADSTDWDNDATQLTTTNTSINITNLTTAVSYQVRVKVICNDGTETAWSNVFTFMPGAYFMPVTGSATMTTCNLMIYDDGGIDNYYSSECNSVLVLIPDNPNAKMMLTGTCNIETNYDQLVIYDGTSESGTVLATLTGSQEVNVISNSGPLTLHFTSDGSVTYPGFAILAQCVNCYPPTNITASNPTLDGATISWIGDASEYAIYLSGASSGYYTTNSNTFTFTGLIPSSMYSVQIRSLCDGDSSVLSTPISFNTNCSAITVTMDNPWVEDFESYVGVGGIPFICWGTPQTYIANNGTYPLVFCGNGAACHSGVNSGEFRGSANVLVLPEFNNDIADLRLSFWATTSMTSSGAIEVGYVTDPLDASTFVAIANAGEPGPRGSASAGNGNFMGPFDFNGVSMSSARIALRYTNTSSLSVSWNVDDFTVELSPNCPSPVKTSVTASNIDGHSATISWVDNDTTHTAWTVYYREADAVTTDPWMSQAATADHVTISGLDPETSYDAYVVTECGIPFATPDATLTITFTTTIACPAPVGLTLVEVATDQATIGWTSNASSFIVEYGPANFTPGTGTRDTIPQSTITISNLAAFTEYTVIVMANCGGEDGVSSPVVMNFTTTQHSVALPYTADFTNPNDTWILNNGVCSNFWTTGTIDSVPALYVSHDNATAVYDITSFSVVTAEKLFTVGQHGSINVSFDANVGGESNYDYIKVFFAPATESYPAATLGTDYSQTIYSTYALNFQDYLPQTASSIYPYKFNLTQNNTVHMEFELLNPNENPTPNSTAKLVFLWKNDPSVGTQPSAIISNVTVSVTGCPSPTALSDSNITTNSATIYWTPGENETVWEVEYGLHGFTHGTGNVQTVNLPVITLTNLLMSTDYDVYVRAMCSAADSSLWVGPLSFTTACEIFTTYPYVENFDSYEAGSTSRPHCWTFPVTYSLGAPYITSYYSTSAPNCLFFQSSITDHTTAVTPQFDANINTLRVKFMLKAESTTYSGTFEVGVMSDPNDLSTFESVQIIQPENTAWNEYIVDLDGVTMTGPNRYIAFRQNSNSDNWYYWMDDVIVTPIPTCLEPGNIHPTSASATSITLGWAVYGDESSWNIEYGPAGFFPGSGTLINTTNNPCTIDSLTPGTEYDFYIQAVCNADDQSFWVGPYTTLPGAYVMPTSGDYFISACELTIYDDGGPNDNYSNSSNTSLTIYPTDASSLVSIQGTLNTESCCDYLRIYDGIGTSGTMLGEYKGAGVVIPELISTNGPLTIQFYSDISIFSTGFELTVSCYSNSCPAPYDIIASNITTSSANLTWVPGGTETAWVLEYKEHYDTVWTVVPVTTPAYQLTNLNTLTAYDVRVKANCVTGDESMYTYATFNTSGCNYADQCIYTFNLLDSYGDGWNNASLDVEQNGVVIASLTFTNGYSSSENIQLCDNMLTTLVWHQGNFDSECGFSVVDPFGNEVFATTTTPSGLVYSFTSDCTDTVPGPIIIDPTVATTAATDIDLTYATLNGTITNPDTVAITAMGFEWKATVGGTYATVTVTGDSLTYNLTGLTPNTGYTFKAFITYNDTTAYGEEMTFTTLPEVIPEPCDVPNGLHALTTGGDFISIAWNDNPNVGVWNIQYRPVGGIWASATSSTNSYTITGLESETTYQIEVQGDCGDGNLSEWSTTISATTTVGIESWLLNSVSLYPNPAKEYIDVRVDQLIVTSMEVYDVYGKMINTVSVMDNPTRINVSGLAAGMYFVRVTTEQGAVTKSFVKQ